VCENFDSIGKRRLHCVMGSFGLGGRAKANREQWRAVLVLYAEAVEVWAVVRLNRCDLAEPEVLKRWHLVTSAAFYLCLLVLFARPNRIDRALAAQP
jgi:hypothetical protein